MSGYNHQVIRNKRNKSECSDAAIHLASDERLKSVSAYDCILSFETNWIESIEIKGEHMYVGRFGANLNPDDPRLGVEWLEYGCARDEFPLYATPFYPIASSHEDISVFCFGERRSYLEKLIRMGEYVPAVYGILDSLAHVNDKDWSYMLDNYRKVPKSLFSTQKDRSSWIQNPYRTTRR